MEAEPITVTIGIQTLGERQVVLVVARQVLAIQRATMAMGAAAAELDYWEMACRVVRAVATGQHNLLFPVTVGVRRQPV